MGCCAARSEVVAENARVDLKNKVAIVTGANAGGLGQHTTLILAKYNCKVVMTGREKGRLEASAEEIRHKVPGADLLTMVCDMSSFASIRQFVKDFLALNLPLHLLINNAGVMCGPYAKSVDGFELQMATNHLGHFLLTYLLLDTLKASDAARIINVSSGAHQLSKPMDVNNLNTPADQYTPWGNYGLSKLANILHAKELARRLKGTAVTAYSVHPGIIPTKLARNEGCWASFNSNCGSCQKDISQGASTTIYVAMTPNVEFQSGDYFADCAVATPNKPARDPKLAAALWEKSLECCGIVADQAVEGEAKQN